MRRCYLVESDNKCVGQLAASSAKLAMKLMWLGRISRPDINIIVAINTLARHITRWSANDDKRAARLVSYIAATIVYDHVMRINDPPAELWLSLYVDSDFGSSPDMKSTSGFILALQIRSLSSFGDQKLRGRFQDRRRRPNLWP